MARGFVEYTQLQRHRCSFYSSNLANFMGLFCKSTAPFQYLIRNYYHPTQVTTSLPESQFMIIRWICSYIKSHDKHATDFIKHFCRRGYSEAKLKTIFENVWKIYLHKER